MLKEHVISARQTLGMLGGGNEIIFSTDGSSIAFRGSGYKMSFYYHKKSKLLPKISDLKKVSEIAHSLRKASGKKVIITLPGKKLAEGFVSFKLVKKS